jgi:hypothetical protein
MEASFLYTGFKGETKQSNLVKGGPAVSYLALGPLLLLKEDLSISFMIFLLVVIMIQHSR